MLANYRDVFALRDFRRFWIGASLSMFGDGMTRMAFIWFVYQQTNSPAALGILMICYTGPVIVGGLVAGWALDRFDRRTVMIADCLIRGAAIALVPLFHWLGILQLWHVYAAAAVYGLLMMVSLAGIPAMIPSLVSARQLNTANALEILSYTVSGIAGPALAGLLISAIGAPATVLVDVASYFLFALALAGMHLSAPPRAAADGVKARGLGGAIRLVLGNPVLASITAMFIVFSMGMGALSVWLPIYVTHELAGGSALYGLLLSATALGESASALGLGAISTSNRALGIKIAGAQMLAGASIALIALLPGVAPAAIGLFLRWLLQFAADDLGPDAAHGHHPAGTAGPGVCPDPPVDPGLWSGRQRHCRLSAAGPRHGHDDSLVRWRHRPAGARRHGSRPAAPRPWAGSGRGDCSG